MAAELAELLEAAGVEAGQLVVVQTGQVRQGDVESWMADNHAKARALGRAAERGIEVGVRTA